MHIRLLFLALVAAVLVSAPLAAQTPAETRLKAILDRAATAAAALESSLPSFACKENVRSVEREKKKIRRHVEFTADLRVQRRPDGTLSETFQPVDWTALLLHSESGIPFYVSGGFQSAMDYFAAAHALCYRYSLTGPRRLDFVGDLAMRGSSLCERTRGITGFALLDANGDIIHIERHVAEGDAKPNNMVPFAAIDLAPVELNGKIYRLSSHLSADTAPSKLSGHFEADYSDCKLFHATVTILPGSQPIAP